MAQQTRVKVYPSYRGIGQMLRSRELEAGLMLHARGIAAVAVALAPERSGHYRRSFYVTSQKRPDRVVAIVGNDDLGALSIEFGTADTEPHYTLTLALQQAEVRGNL